MNKIRKSYNRRFVAESKSITGDIAIDTGIATITAAADASGVPTFEMEAYTGGPMNVRGFAIPLVVDCQSIEALDVSRPALLEHDYSKRVGHMPAGSIKGGNSITASGLVSATNQWSAEVVASSKNKFPWQASIGATILDSYKLPKGKSLSINGRSVVGPAIIATRTRLNEISFVTLGADENTSVTVAANRHKGKTMNFEAWLKKVLGIEASAVNDEQRSLYKDMFAMAAKKDKTLIVAEGDNAGDDDDEETDDDDESDKDDKGDKGEKPTDAKAAAKAIADQGIAAVRAESARIAKINTICGDKFDDIKAEAIEGGWSVLKTENKVLKKGTPVVKASKPFAGKSAAKVLEASAIVAAGCWSDDRLIKEYGAATLEASHDRFHGRMGLQELLIECAVLNGYQGRHSMRDPQAYREIIATGFSNTAISGILSNVANKRLLEGFTGVERKWMEIAKRSSVTNFQKRTSYRMTLAGDFKKVGPDGKIEHGTLGEKFYDIQADEYGLMIAVTRKQIRNDDLGAITDVPRQIGYQAGQAINMAIWPTIMAAKAAGFFTAAKGNLLDSGTTPTAKVLGIQGYGEAETRLRSMKTDDGKPIGTASKPKLIVPPALAGIARQIMNSQQLTIDASTSTGTANPQYNRADIVDTDWMGAAADATNGSDADYIVARNADILPLIEIAFLDGIEVPKVEQEEADFEHTGGIKMKGQLDFGVAMGDERAAVYVDN